MREQYGDNAFLIGFSTYTGTVTADSQWDAPAELKDVNPGLPESYEDLFHQVGLSAFMLSEERLQRVIRLIYLPQTERQSHYYYATIPDLYDVLIFIDETQALEALPHSTVNRRLR